MENKPSYPRKEALPPIKRKAGLTSNEVEAQRDNETWRGPQRRKESNPRRDAEASETA